MSRDLILLAVSLFTWGLGEGMFLYFQPLYLQKWGADALQLGTILSAAGIAMVVAQIPAGYLGDRYGARRIMWTSWVIGCIATGMMAAANSLVTFSAGIVVYALTSYVSAPMNSYITAMRGRWSVQRAMTFISAVYSLGAILGPSIGGWIGQQEGLGFVYRVAAVIFIFSTLLVFFLREPPKEENLAVNADHAPAPGLLQNPRMVGFLTLITFTMFSMYMVQPLTSVYLQNQKHLDYQAIGGLGSFSSLGNFVLLIGLGHLEARAGMLIGQVLVGLFALLLWQGNSVLWYGLGYFFFGGYRLSRMMALTYIRKHVNAREVGLAYGLVETSNAIAVIAAPLAAGALYSLRPDLVYIVGGGIIGLMILVNFFKLPATSE